MIDVPTRTILLKQQKLTSTIETLIATNYKACSAFNKLDFQIDTIQGAYENIVTSISEIQKHITRFDKNMDDCASNMCSKVSSIIDDAIPTDNADTLAKIEALTSVTNKIGDGQCLINDKLKRINQELIELSVRDLGPAVNEMIEEIKAISANLPAANVQPDELHKTLADELAAGMASGSLKNDKSGWRTIGEKRVWKADWTDYDTRAARHKEQLKLRAKAIQRKRRRQRRQRRFSSTDELDYSQLNDNFHLERHNDRLHYLY